jgi:tripartite-type tricarboxylate transporter receptor subunit TctC
LKICDFSHGGSCGNPCKKITAEKEIHMKRVSLTILLTISVALISYVLPGYALAKYPERAVTVLTPHPAGGDTDMVARAITEAARADFPKGIAVVNRVGGGGTIGITELVRSKPDGYTLCSAPTAPLLVGPHRLDVPYNTANDYQPIIRMVTSYFALAVGENAPWKTLPEFLAFARANPGKIRIGMPGEGTIPHLAAVRFSRLSKIDLTIVPFTGGTESVKSLLGGHIDANIQSISEIIAHVQAGSARVLVSFDENRNSLLPDVPTAKESGVDMTASLYHSIIGPKGLSPEIVSALHDIFKRAMNDPTFRKTMENKGYVFSYEGPEDLKKRLLEEYETYGQLIRQIGLGK